MKKQNYYLLVLSVVLLSSFSISTAGMMVKMKEFCTVIAMYVKNPSEVGEIAPISETSGKELVRFVGKHKDAGCNYLEVGAGCGAITELILKKMNKNDHLDIVEINQTMCEMLRQRFGHLSNITINCCSILDWKPTCKYDAIISTLPFNSLDFSLVQSVVAYYKQVSLTGCVISYVEYGVCRAFLELFGFGDKKKQFLKVQKLLKNIRKTCLKEEHTVYYNVPPLCVYHLCLVN